MKKGGEKKKRGLMTLSPGKSVVGAGHRGKKKLKAFPWKFKGKRRGETLHVSSKKDTSTTQANRGNDKKMQIKGPAFSRAEKKRGKGRKPSSSYL